MRVDLPGVYVLREPTRQYVFKENLAHLLGYTGGIPEDKLARYQDLGAEFDEKKGVAGVYYNRYLDYLSKLPNDVSLSAGVAGYMGSDPSAEYARDTDHPPTNGKWWADLGDFGYKVDPQSSYNTEAGAQPPHRGLPPGPIAAAIKDVIYVSAIALATR